MMRSLCLERLESRRCTAVDYAESNAADWGTFASDQAATSIANDTANVRHGASSLRLDTQSGFDTGVTYPRLGNAHWDLSGFEYLTFLQQSENNNPGSFQGEQPILVLRSGSGSFRYTPKQSMIHVGDWQKIAIRLQGDDFWKRDVIGTPSLSDVNQLELHYDTWGYGFRIWLDGVRFETTQSLVAPTPPAGVDPNVVHSKALLYIFNPVMENLGGTRQNVAYGWQDPESLAQQVIGDFARSSHGRLQYEIAATQVVDAHPYFKDGFQHTDATFAQAWSQRDFHNSEFDYPRFLTENRIGERIDRGEFDEVWIYAGPISGMWESAMAGGDAFWINGPPQSGGGKRAFPIMGWNFERGVGEAIHSWGHRAESTLDHAYRFWQSASPSTWRQFTTIDRDAPGRGAVGNVHFPVNGTSDYDYNNARTVQSSALDWLNYPNRTGALSAINNRTWSPTGADPQREYLQWWYQLMPHAEGRGPDGYLANWWRYLADPNAIKTRNGSVAYASNLADILLSRSTSSTSPSTRLQTFQADVLADGAIGRVDFYLNGRFVSSDSLAPFRWDWDPSGAIGENVITAKAYELVHGWEFVSNSIAVTIAPSLWRNPVLPLDIDDDGGVSPLDVLGLINDINAFQSRQLPSTRPADALFLDPDNDGFVTPLDVLMVINDINARGGGGGGEGESSPVLTKDLPRGESESLDACFAAIAESLDADALRRRGRRV